jgi:hypothetical protein
VPCKIQRHPRRAISFWQYRSQVLPPRWLHIEMQVSSEHEFFLGGCCACAGKIPAAANPTSKSTTAEIRNMRNPPVRYRRQINGLLNPYPDANPLIFCGLL